MPAGFTTVELSVLNAARWGMFQAHLDDVKAEVAAGLMEAGLIDCDYPWPHGVLTGGRLRLTDRGRRVLVEEEAAVRRGG